MNRKQVFQELDELFKIGFSYMTVKGLITKIYDSLENTSNQATLNFPNKGEIPAPNIQKIAVTGTKFNSVDKAITFYNDDLFTEIIKRSDIEGYDIPSTTKFLISSSEYGKLIYYPKSDKTHITKSNEWKNYGFNWLYKNIKNQ